MALLDTLIQTKVTLACPKCKKEKIVKGSIHDPVNTARAELLCPECNPGGFDDVRYFDANGNPLTPA